VDFGPLQVADVGRLTALRDSLGALFVVMQPTRRT
jgi:predicted enzyme related to lactoylglutathione lyase